MNSQRLSIVLIACALAAAACTSSSGEDIGLPGSEVQNTSTTLAAVPTTSTSTTSPGTVDDSDPSGAIDAWISMWDGVERITEVDGAAEQSILAVAESSVLEQLSTIYDPSVESDVGNSARTFENNPVVDTSQSGLVTINDCMFETPKIGNATIWYSGTVVEVDGTWKVQSVNLEAEIGCVPAPLAAAAIQGYENYWDARVEFWDPADPTHVLVEETLTGEQLTLIRSLLVDHEANGLALRGRAEDHPEVIEVRSSSEIAILDCKFQDPQRGLYDIASGDRLDVVPAIADGQRDLTSAVMVFEDGVWKVSDVQGQAGVSCDIAPTTQGLPVV